MAVTAAATLIVLLLAYVAQSPRLLKRLGLGGTRLDLRARALTGYALALLLLAFGFFIAGVPLGNQPEPTSATAVAEAAAPTAIVDTDESGAMAGIATATPSESSRDASGEEAQENNEPASGAFGGPPPAAQTATAEAAELSGELTPTTTATPLPTATATPTQTATATPTPSPTATTTPTPTLTPTPIFAETATINTGTSTLWVKRMPGGRDIALVRGGDIVVLMPGHANVGGAVWREVSTVDGTLGWVMESYLRVEAEGESEAN
jgi:hypothetical protein